MKDWLEEASVLVGCFINCAFISVIIALVGFVSLKVIIYGISAEEAYKVASQCVAIASDAIRKFGISILNDDRKWEDTE